MWPDNPLSKFAEWLYLKFDKKSKDRNISLLPDLFDFTVFKESFKFTQRYFEKLLKLIGGNSVEERLKIAQSYVDAKTPYKKTGNCSKENKKTGVDCSCLIEKLNPDYFEKANKIKNCPDVSTGNKSHNCNTRTQKQLQMLKKDGRDDITDPEELKKGDAAYFSGMNRETKMSKVEHVFFITSQPKCTTQNKNQICTMGIINASSGKKNEPGKVKKGTLRLTNECYCVKGKDKGGRCIKGIKQCLEAGGTPP